MDNAVTMASSEGNFSIVQRTETKENVYTVQRTETKVTEMDSRIPTWDHS